MENKNYGKFSKAMPVSKTTFSGGFGGAAYQNQAVSKLNENKPLVLPRRRSRLGTRPSLMRNQELPVYNDTNNHPRISSQKKVQSGKKPIPIVSSTPEDFYNQNAVKKRLFSRSPIPRRLNMDTSSRIHSAEPSSENHDPDVTGVCYMGDTIKRNQKNAGYLTSCENNLMPLRSHKLFSTPSKSFLHKSPFPSACKSAGKKLSTSINPAMPFLKNNQLENRSPPSPPKSLYLRNHLKQTVESPKMPKTFFPRNRCKQIIESPKLPSSTIAVLAAIKKRHALSNLDSNITTSNSGLTAGYKMSEIDLDIAKSSSADDKDKPVCSEFVSAKLPSNKLSNSESINRDSTFMIDNPSNKCDPDNSLEVTCTKVNGTYDIIDTSTKIQSNANLGGVTTDIAGLMKNNENFKIEEHNNTILDVKPTTSDRSPSFIVFSRRTEQVYDFDDTTETFIHQESICNESTLIFSKGESSIKKLSTIKEDTVGNSPTCTGQCNNALVMNAVSNLSDIIDKSQKERVSFLITYNKFVNDQQNYHDSTVNCLNEIKNLIKEKDKCCNDVCFRIDNNINNLENIMKATNISAAVPQTPDHIRRIVSKSVYNELKTDYSCLKTPKASTVKKCKSNRKILTPHSMSLCVQDQVDQLFDD